MSLDIIILAAGKGTRMCSNKPKVLHEIAGQAMLAHVIKTAQNLVKAKLHVIYGHQGEKVKQALAHFDINWIEQAQQLGTGHAVQQALPHLDPNGISLVLYADVPLIKVATLEQLLNLTQSTGFALLTACLEQPQGYGRVIRNQVDKIQSIVEQKDASPEQLMINEINTGILAVKTAYLKPWLDSLSNRNTQKEYYLTDIIAKAVADGIEIASTQAEKLTETMGINNHCQQAYLERIYQQQQVEHLMTQGLTLLDPKRFDLRGELKIGQDVIVDINVLIQGQVSLGHNVKIGANVVIKDSQIGDNVEILPNSVIEQAKIAEGCRIGPFARIRPETELAQNVRVGNFVEIKKSQIAQGSKINHLSYIGDTIMGSQVNIGAGTITCNYDGAYKHQTIIGDNAFIGSDTQLVAPVIVGQGAMIGAGSTITANTPENELTLSRSKQKTIHGWKRPSKTERMD